MNERCESSAAHNALDAALAALLLLVLNAYALDLLRQPLTPFLPCLLTAVEVAIAAAVLRSRPAVAIDRGEALGLLLTLAGVLIVFLAPSLPSLYPPSSGVDAVHHFLLADFIYQNHALPHDIVALSPYLGEMAVYPFAPALLTALAAQVVQQSPLVVLHPFMALVRAMSAGYVFLMVYRWLPPQRWRMALALCAPLLLFAPATYFVGALLGDQYYFAQVFAELLVVALLANLAGDRNPRRAALATSALVLSYPAWLPVMLLGSAAIVTLRQESWPSKARDGVLLALALAGLLIVFLPGRMQAGGSVLRWEGIAAAPGVAAFGWPFLALAGVGVLVALRNGKRLWPVLLVAGVCLSQSAAMFVLADVLHLAARYHFYKSLYLLVYPLAVLATLGLAAGVGVIRGRVAALGAAGAALLVAALIAWQGLSAAHGIAPIQVLRPQEVAAAEWVKNNLDVTQVGYRTRYGITSYWLHVGILGNKRESFLTDSFIELLPMTSDEWLHGGAWPQYFLVSDGSEPEGDQEVIYRDRGVVVLARQPVTAPRVTIEQRADADIGGLVHIAGYSAGRRVVAPGQTFDISVHWWVLHWPHSPTPVYIYAHLLDNANRALGKVDQQPQGARFRSLRWPMGVVNSDTFSIAVPPDATPGRYWVQVGMYDGETLKDMPITGADRQPVERLLLGPFKAPLPTVTARPGIAMDTIFGGRIKLLGFDADKQAARPGATLALRLYWQAAAAMKEDYTLFVHMTNDAGQPVAQCDVQPLNGAYPTSIWDMGEVVTTDCALGLPPSLALGTYSLRAGVYLWPSLARLALDSGADAIDIGRVTVAQP